jgi:hypothetical protein
MLWLTWRQHRLQVLALAAVLGALTGYLVQLTLPMVEPARLLNGCADGSVAVHICDDLSGRYVGINSPLNLLLFLANLLPALAGMFLGAPLLAREFERGTHRLVWGQGVSRRRWLVVKLALIGTGVLAAGTAQGLVLLWVTDQWRVTESVNRFANPLVFGVIGIVPAALWLFAFVLGVAMGLVVRRATAAMALTLVGLALVVVGLNLVRPHFATPATRPWVAELDESASRRIATVEWIQGNEIRDAAGRTVPHADASRLCPHVPHAPLDPACLAAHGLRQFQRYQPADRFWRFQCTEAGILLVGTVLIGELTIARVARRPD